MILVNAVIDLRLPDPSPAELVTVSSLVEEYVSRDQPERFGLSRGYPDSFYSVQYEPTALHISYAKIGDFDVVRIALFLAVLGDSTDDGCDLTKSPPSPSDRKIREFAVV
ncbi:hypothetical protein SVTN_24585 [Streptomyces vietnamensis]|uniref:Uncharacterized protein n=1 Tax=Streptomyces vietnamensis TaxID=362257 RepID=A0A0B5IFC7_9ACTN|nr:hypothetical protein SVTN_24585 [Streptomyces vietnamensis]